MNSYPRHKNATLKLDWDQVNSKSFKIGDHKIGYRNRGIKI